MLTDNKIKKSSEMSEISFKIKNCLLNIFLAF